MSSITGGADKVWYLNPVLLASFLQTSSNNCSSPLTKENLKKIASGITTENVDRYLNDINTLLPQNEINSCLRKGHLLAQIIHESGSFRYTRELGATLDYDPWRGRGLIQITFEDNYRLYGAFANEDTYSSLANMQKLESPPHSLLSAIWYWNNRDINAVADKDDFIAVTIAINGGLNGYNHRLEALNAYIDEMGVADCFIKNKNRTYIFEESVAYSSRRSCFAWGLWSDPGLTKSGKTKSKEEALKGYRRMLQLHEAAGRPPMPRGKKWYGYADPPAIANARITELSR